MAENAEIAEDAEIKAIQALVAALKDLEPDVRARVLGWAAERYGVGIAPRRKTAASPEAAPTPSEEPDRQFGSFAELHDRANPKTEAMRALVGGYWFQAQQHQADFTGQQVNDELKQLGHPLSNVTVAFRQLQKRSPVLARQVQKSGKTKQARKRYKLTEAGITRVEAMLRGEAPE